MLFWATLVTNGSWFASPFQWCLPHID
jgi:hypothetical protein